MACFHTGTCPGAGGTKKVDYGDYEIHYIAVPNTLLEPDIAKAYGLERSKLTGMLNIFRS